MGFFVFDHRPPLALRAEDTDANDPERLARSAGLATSERHHAPSRRSRETTVSHASTRSLSSASARSRPGAACPPARNGASSSELWVKGSASIPVQAGPARILAMEISQATRDVGSSVRGDQAPQPRRCPRLLAPLSLHQSFFRVH
jgi:hypothetical protein